MRKGRNVMKRELLADLKAAGFTVTDKGKHTKAVAPDGQDTLTIKNDKRADPGAVRDVGHAILKVQARAAALAAGIRGARRGEYLQSVTVRPGERTTVYADMLGVARNGASGQLRFLEGKGLVYSQVTAAGAIWYPGPALPQEPTAATTGDWPPEEEQPGGFADAVDAHLDMQSEAQAIEDDAEDDVWDDVVSRANADADAVAARIAANIADELVDAMVEASPKAQWDILITELRNAEARALDDLIEAKAMVSEFDARIIKIREAIDKMVLVNKAVEEVTILLSELTA